MYEQIGQKIGNWSHGMHDTKMYHKWENIKQRCLNPNHPQYKDYGGRGIDVCEEWMEFNNFKDWCFENGYDDDLEIDRIDNDKGYRPSNCRFVTKVVNSYNRRSTRFYEYKGKIYNMFELSRMSNIHPTTLRTRMFNGMTVKEAVETPVRKTGRYNHGYYKIRKTQRNLQKTK